MLDGDKVAAMVHLGDVYAGLAAPDRQWAVNAMPYDHPECFRCRVAMRRTHVADATDQLPAMQRFECRRCGDTLICKRN